MKIGVHQTFYDINLTIKYCYSDFHHCSPFRISRNHLSDCWSKFPLTWNVCAIYCIASTSFKLDAWLLLLLLCVNILLFLFPIPLSCIGTIVRVVYGKIVSSIWSDFIIFDHISKNVNGSIVIYDDRPN